MNRGKMTTASITELPALIRKFAQCDASGKPLGIITTDFNTKMDIIHLLESDSGFRRVNDLLIAGADKYFDAEGNLVPDIAQREQLLADGTKYNAAKYLASRAADYIQGEWSILFAVHNVYTPEMAGVARYVAREAGLPLVALLPTVNDPASTYAAYDVVVCEK